MSRMVVLVVEDEPHLVSIYQRALEHRGYQVLTAMTGEEALKIIEAEDGSIDLMLSDIVMPGISGRELVWRVREMHPDIKIILASGYANEDGALQLMEDLGVVFVPKPVDLNDLMDVVRDSIAAPTDQ